MGDFGFDYKVLSEVNSQHHKIIAGNHDNYNNIKENNYPHFLGDFGRAILNGVDFFFIRGAYSVDKAYRQEHISWWKDEELTYGESHKCFDSYLENKPSIVISHDCPTVMCERFKYSAYVSSNTQYLLQELFNAHEPDRWYFGHHHRNITEKIGKTTFTGLGELKFLDID
ncbi:unnamed protein product [marine sediment metagenome]|uniref:Calcineurin-like phosphoesterase domain-containing protein n=1 Tax=marine sediment metagenome TaxID=412755 RepID=X0WY44_9ZZZZ